MTKEKVSHLMITIRSITSYQFYLWIHLNFKSLGLRTSHIFSIMLYIIFAGLELAVEEVVQHLIVYLGRCLLICGRLLFENIFTHLQDSIDHHFSANHFAHHSCEIPQSFIISQRGIEKINYCFLYLSSSLFLGILELICVFMCEYYIFLFL